MKKETLKNASSFVKQVIAQLKGDTDAVIAEKNERKARAAISAQLSALVFTKEENKDTLETAKENLVIAKYPTDPITGNGLSYVMGITNAQENLNDAQENYDATIETIEYLEGVLKEFN